MKVKYKLNTKIGTPIKLIEINIHSDSNQRKMIGGYHNEGINIEDYKIVYQTKYKIAINDPYITKFDRQKVDEKKQTYKHYINECSISVLTKETYFPNGIFGQIHTTLDEETAIKKLTQAMQRKIDNEYGWLSKIDVNSFVISKLKQQVK